MSPAPRASVAPPKSARRVVVPIVVTVLALSVVLIMALTRSGDADPAAPPVAGQTSPPPTDADAAAEPAVTADEPAPPGPGPDALDPAPDLGPLFAVAPDPSRAGPAANPPPLGTLDVDEMLVTFSPDGAGIRSIVYSDIWKTYEAKLQAQRATQDPEVERPGTDAHYVLVEPQPLLNSRVTSLIEVPALAANLIEINGQPVNVFSFRRDADGQQVWIWSATDDPGRFETMIVAEDGSPVLRIERRFTHTQAFGLQLDHRFVNLIDQPLVIRWTQFGPGDLRVDPFAYIDRRRMMFGFLYPEDAQQLVQSSTSDLLFERNDVIKRGEKGRLELWPNDESKERGLQLSWFAATNRYFALAVTPALDPEGNGPRTLGDVVARIVHEESFPTGSTKSDQIEIFTYLESPTFRIAPESDHRLRMGIYAGPLDEPHLDDTPAYSAVRLDHMVLYQMSSFCAMCTFQWLAHLLIGFLSLLHSLTGDWAIGIIALVCVVRTCLHPITKKSQISMQRFGKQMSEMKPELDRLQKKYGEDPKKMQQEQLRMMRERGISPLGALGCLPMFLQTPIWIALYAGLYFAYPLRHEPAFWGFFQMVSGGHWAFLADLSAPDHFFWQFDEPLKGFAIWRNITGINLLPLLMGAIFFVQQKYMSPPPTPNMSEDQLRQQKIMKVLMVVLFPIMLYSAPSGLTLYIMTSSLIGIFESRYIRAHVTAMDLNPPDAKSKKSTKPRDAKGRAYAAALKRVEQKKREQKRGPEKKFKKRR